VTGEQDDPQQPGEAGTETRARLRVVQGPMPSDGGDEAPPPVRLRREFKGLTVADLHREEVAGRLPGQVRSALQHLENGDVAAAEHAMPGEFGRVLAGPGHRRRTRYGWLLLVGIVAIATGVVVANCLLS
jgi:hypothetical protein